MAVKEYKIVEARKKDAEEVMNTMAKQGWEVVSMSYWYQWRIRLLITFSKEV